MSLSNCEWKEYKLGDLIKFGNGKVRPTSTGSIPVYGGNGILDYCNEFNYEEETIIIGRVGAYCGAVYYENKPIWVSDNALAAKAKEKFVTKFLYYFLKNLELNQFAEGSSHPLVTQSLLNSIDIYITDNENEQRTIASILSSLDDKIDLLHRQNKTLEQLAETLFRQWFLSNQKSNVKTQKFGNLVQFIKGKKPNNAVEIYIEGLVPQILIETFDTGKTLYSDPTDMVIANKKDILMVMDGASSGRVEIGICGIVGSTIGLFRPTKDFDYSLFLFYFLKANEDFIKENTTGSAIPHTDRALVLHLDVEYPSIEKVREFELIAENYFDKKQANKNQIRTLTQLRDTLLPKLMSGEVRVNIVGKNPEGME